MSGSEDQVKVEIDSDGIAWVTLNEPEVRNALSPELRAQFVERIPPLEFDDSVRCVVIRGAGAHFMAGGDIRIMRQRLQMETAERSRNIVSGLHDIHHAIQPVVHAILCALSAEPKKRQVPTQGAILIHYVDHAG